MGRVQPVLLACAGLLAWPALAQAAATGAAVPAQAAQPLPDLDAAIADFPPLPGTEDIDVPWPTVEATTAATTAAPQMIRYEVSVTGLQPLGLQDEFDALSTLMRHRKDEANIAQVNRRITEDRDLIDQLLRSIGHYGGSVAVERESGQGEAALTRIRFVVTPGPVYRFGDIVISRTAEGTGPEPAPIVRPLLGLRSGDAVDAARVMSAQDALPVRLADAGYPFPLILKPDITIDHATTLAEFRQQMDLGRRGVFGDIRITGETQGFTPEHLARLARFRPGDPYTNAGKEDLRRALINTGLFGAAIIKPVENGPINPDGTQRVDIEIAAEAAPLRSVAAAFGYGTGQGIRIEGSWSHRNLFPPEGSLTLRGVAAQREQVLEAEFRRRNFRVRDQSLIVTGGLSASQQFAYQAATVGIGATLLRESNIIWQKPFTYTVGAQFLGTSQLDRSLPEGSPRQQFLILAFPSSLTWDQSDDLLNPTRGYRLTGRLSPELSLREGQNFNYVKAQIEGTAYQPFGDVVLAGRLHLGTIAGSDRGRIAPDRRFYAGGGGSVRGYDFQGVGPQDADGTPIGGNSITEASFEVRYRFTAWGNDIGMVAFVDAGQVSTGATPRFDDLRFGAGLGVRYFTSFGPVRVDVATPIGRRPGDPTIAFYVSIGQAF